MERFPDEMTIVIQHRFWDLKVEDDDFTVGLSFGGVPATLHVPFAAVTQFHDPAVEFALTFQANATEEAPEEHEEAENDAPKRRRRGRRVERRQRGLYEEEIAGAASPDVKRATCQTNTRTETDSFGPIEVPADAYWGAQTERSIENFPFGPREQMPLEIVHALGFVKQAAARVNARIGGLDPKLAEAIQQAAAEVARGDLDSQFPLVIWQTGSGTQSNMNANEVIAGRANEILTGKRGGKDPVHPNDHVNKSQSSNDSFPTAMHIAAARAVTQSPAPGARDDARAARRPGGALGLDRQDRPHPSAGRNPADARPGILGLCSAGPGLHRAGRGGACRGCSGWPRAAPRSAPGSTRRKASARSSPRRSPTSPNCRSRPAPNKFAELAAHDTLVELSGVLNVIAVALSKIANDIRLMGSGPALRHRRIEASRE